MKQKDEKYLEYLAELFPTIGKASTEIINLQSIINLPKGTRSISFRIFTGSTKHFPMCSETAPGL